MPTLERTPARRSERRLRRTAERIAATPSGSVKRELWNISVGLRRYANSVLDSEGSNITSADSLLKLANTIGSVRSVKNVLAVRSADEDIDLTMPLGEVYGNVEAKAATLLLSVGEGEALPTTGSLKKTRTLYETGTPGIVVVKTEYPHEHMKDSLKVMAATPTAIERMKKMPKGDQW